MENRFIASMVLHALGDTIGYNNSKWEFMEGKLDKIHEKVNQFISYGGINYVPNKGWLISDDTIMHIKTANGLLEKFNNVDELFKQIRIQYINAFDEFRKEGISIRQPGITLMKNIDKLKDGLAYDQMDYDFDYGGSGASMRTSCIGLAFNKNTDDDNYLLLRISIESSRITHNSAIGYLGGYVSALFTMLAINNVDIKKWPFILLDMLKQKMKEYIESVGRDVGNYSRDHHVFLKKWKTYIDAKFNEEGEPIKRRSDKNLVHRSKYYHSMFGDERNPQSFFIGSGGDDSVIIAYDCLVDSGNNWEKLVFYAMLHVGDTDTTGCIAGSWYGALYGFGDVPMNVLDNLERKNEIVKIAKKLYKLFYKS
jgi:ADP-ribosylarginine hydrolase